MGMFDMGNIDWGQIAGGMGTPGMDPLAEVQRRWPTPGMTAETMPTMPQSPLTPELLAKQAAARGIPPPAQDLPPGNVGAALTGTGLPGDSPFRMPSPGAHEAWRAATPMPEPEVFNKGTPNNYDRTPGAPASPVTAAGAPAPSTEMSAQSKDSKKEDKTPSFADTLKGVKAPAGPELQKLGTPAAPRPTNQIKAGDIVALLQALNAGGGAGGMQLPSTLGQALLGRK